MTSEFLAKYAIKTATEQLERKLKEIDYKGIFEAPLWIESFGFLSSNDLTYGALALPVAHRYCPIERILCGPALAPPHGIEAFKPPPIPTVPTTIKFEIADGIKIPRVMWRNTVSQLTDRLESHRKLVAEKVLLDQPNIARAAEIVAACTQGNLVAIRTLILTVIDLHPLPEMLAKESDFTLDVGSRVALCTIELPNLIRLPWVKLRANSNWVSVSSDADRKKASDYTLAALCIRAAYLVAMGDPGDFFDTVAVNARQKWVDPTTGHPKEGIVASLQATKSVLCQLEPEHLDAKACFRHLSGISTPNLLVSQVFEWMFANDGVEVKVTRASRDRGVDAIMFDPDPIRGGKYVLQAKRYTRTVDVAAVRDLYGTVVNEGANRGILVTTASYGPDAYEFAKDKPISLIDGPNLIALLKKHGRIYRIDLEEARRAD
jgi:Restriction endonuclease